jgi:hypothetical protein
MNETMLFQDKLFTKLLELKVVGESLLLSN